MLGCVSPGCFTAIGATHPDTATTYNGLGLAYKHNGNYEVRPRSCCDLSSFALSIYARLLTSPQKGDPFCTKNGFTVTSQHIISLLAKSGIHPVSFESYALPYRLDAGGTCELQQSTCNPSHCAWRQASGDGGYIQQHRRRTPYAKCVR